jgi:hypothetical protein
MRLLSRDCKQPTPTGVSVTHTHLYLEVSLPMGSLFKLLSDRGKIFFYQVDARILPHLGILIFIVVVVARSLHIIVVLRALALARAVVVVVAVVLGVDPD